MKIYQPGFDERRIKVAAEMLPLDLLGTTDKYFPRTQAVLKSEGWNPWVTGQLFARPKGISKPKFSGVYDTLAVFTRPEYRSFLDNGGRIWALEEGSEFQGTETLMVFEGYAQDLIVPETNYLGLTSAAMTEVNMGITQANLGAIEQTMLTVNRTLSPRHFKQCDVSYFGARHYHPFWDGPITRTMWKGGARFSSTDNGAQNSGQLGVGTSPHFLAQVACYFYGLDRAVVEATMAFNRLFGKTVPTVCLNDYAGKELTDGRAVIKALGDQLSRFRLDTAGERVAEGAIPNPEEDPDGFAKASTEWKAKGLYLPEVGDPIGNYWWGRGVTISATVAMVHMQKEAGFDGPPPMLTSGFSNASKIRAFVQAEKLLEMDLLSGGIGIGEVQPGVFTKMDVIALGGGLEGVDKIIHKAGRKPNPSLRLKPALGDFSGNPKNPYVRLGLAAE